jgi:hypothetical protein
LWHKVSSASAACGDFRSRAAKTTDHRVAANGPAADAFGLVEVTLSRIIAKPAVVTKAKTYAATTSNLDPLRQPLY